VQEIICFDVMPSHRKKKIKLIIVG